MPKQRQVRWCTTKETLLVEPCTLHTATTEQDGVAILTIATGWCGLLCGINVVSTDY